MEEELCSSCRLSLAVDCDGNVLTTTMEGNGGIPYQKLNDVIKVQRTLILPYTFVFLDP